MAGLAHYEAICVTTDHLRRPNIAPVGFELLPGALGRALRLKVYHTTRTALNISLTGELTLNLTNNPKLVYAALLYPQTLRLRPSAAVTPPALDEEDVALTLECVAGLRALDGRGWLTVLASPARVSCRDVGFRPLSRAEAALLEMLVAYTKLTFFIGSDHDLALSALNVLTSAYEIVTRLGDAELRVMAEDVMERAAAHASLLGYRAEA